MIAALVVASLISTSPAVEEEVFRMVEIEVSGDPVYTISHSIVVSVSKENYARSRDDVAQRRWTAVRTSERGRQTVNSDECAPLDAAVTSFLALPSLSTRDTWAIVMPRASQMSPIMLHGFPTRLKWRTLDGTQIETTGGYWHRRWAHDAVSGLMECWGALIPEENTGQAAQNSQP
jgi:hypothetical protein